jgi:hypothetical protein
MTEAEVAELIRVGADGGSADLVNGLLPDNNALFRGLGASARSGPNVFREFNPANFHVVKYCGSKYYDAATYWKNGLGGHHLHQDTKWNRQKDGYAGRFVALGQYVDGAHQVAAAKVPIEVLATRFDYCSVPSPWPFSYGLSGNWLTNLIDAIIGYTESRNKAKKPLCQIAEASNDRGLKCMNSQCTGDRAAQVVLHPDTRRYIEGGYTNVLYKIRSTDGKRQLIAQCNGDDLYWGTNLNDPTYFSLTPTTYRSSE